MGSEESDASGSHPEMTGGSNASDAMPRNESELLSRALLDNARDVYKLIESRSELNPHQDRQLAVKIFLKLTSYHSDVIDKFIEEGTAKAVACWSFDLNRLR